MPPKKKGKGKKGKKGGKGDKDDGATEGGKVGTPEPSEKELLLQQEYVCKLTIYLFRIISGLHLIIVN